MNAERLLAHYERLSPTRPRPSPVFAAFVLDLAVRGKLVEQDPSDEPVAELLERIAAKKARLVKASNDQESRRQSRLRDASKTWFPFEIPACMALGQARSRRCNHCYGEAPPSASDPTILPSPDRRSLVDAC